MIVGFIISLLWYLFPFIMLKMRKKQELSQILITCKDIFALFVFNAFITFFIYISDFICIKDVFGIADPLLSPVFQLFSLWVSDKYYRILAVNDIGQNGKKLCYTISVLFNIVTIFLWGVRYKETNIWYCTLFPIGVLISTYIPLESIFESKLDECINVLKSSLPNLKEVDPKTIIISAVTNIVILLLILFPTLNEKIDTAIVKFSKGFGLATLLMILIIIIIWKLKNRDDSAKILP